MIDVYCALIKCGRWETESTKLLTVLGGGMKDRVMSVSGGGRVGASWEALVVPSTLGFAPFKMSERASHCALEVLL